jgi:hypothetical protein
VCIKMIQDPRKVQQIRILQWFSTRTETRNHVVTYLDTFSDNYMPNTHYLVTPVLRRFDDPEFGSISEIVDFVTQILEVCLQRLKFVQSSSSVFPQGMAFLHENNIAHQYVRDATFFVPCSNQGNFVHFQQPHSRAHHDGGETNTSNQLALCFAIL